MNLLKILYVVAFGTAALASLAGVLRAAKVDDIEVRYGLVGLLAGSGVWAASHAVMFVAPGPTLKRAIYIVGLIFGFSTVWAWLYFCSAYTRRVYHRSRTLRRIGVATYLGVVGVKLTNPFHHLYFEAAVVEAPFRHLAIQQGLFHWTVTGLSYSLAAVGLFVLFESFLRADYDTRPLGALTAATALPIVLDLVGFATPELVDIIYAPLGVSVFALGVLFVYEDRFLAVKMSGDRQYPTVVVDDEDRIRDYNAAAESVFPSLPDSEGEPLSAVVPSADGELRGDGGGQVISVDRDDGTRYFLQTRDPIVVGQKHLGAVVNYTDVTQSESQRRELERAYGELERERDRFASLFQYLPDPVNEVEFVDGKPVVRAVNPAFEETFGYDESELLGRNAYDIVTAPAEADTDPEHADAAVLEGEVVTEAVRRHTAEGIKDFLFRGIPYRTDGNTRALGVYTDITEQKRRQRRLSVLNRVLRHNLRNEMTVVEGYAQLLVDQVDDDLANTAEELLDAAGDLTAISEHARQAENALQNPDGSPDDLPTVVESTVESYRARYPDATIETEIPVDRLLVDAGDISLVLENLLENALQHNDSATPTVRVVVRRTDDDRAIVRVEDDGPGIPAHERGVVTGEREVTQLEHGSGLGLWVVKWVTEAGGGSVRFGETDLGGAAVELRLPAVQDPESEELVGQRSGTGS